MKIKNFLAAAFLCMSAFTAQASTVLIPTDGDVNIFIDIPFLADIPDGSYIGLFDDADAASMSTASHLVIDSNQIVGISGPFPGDVYRATSLSGVLDLSGNAFVLGLFTGGSWYADTGTADVSLGANSALLEFIVPSETGPEPTSATTFAIDVDVSPIPVPAAVWLFGAGLMGLAGVARRRT